MRISSLKSLAYSAWARGMVAIVAQAMLAGVARAQRGLPGIPILESGDVDIATNVIVCRVAGYMFWILITLSVVFVLIAAYKYLTSSGDEQKVSSATKTITYAAIAIVVALFAKGLPMLIGSLLGVYEDFTVC